MGCHLTNPTWNCSTSTHSGSSVSKENKDESAAAVDGLVVDDSSSSSSSSSSSNVDASSSTSTAPPSKTPTCGLLPAGTLPQQDAACSAALPTGTSTIWCDNSSFAGAGDTQTDTACTCDSTNPIWKCTATNTPLAPNQPCPPVDQPQVSGNSCVGQVSQPNSFMTCMWSRSVQVSSTSDAMQVSSISCDCTRGADGSVEENNELWVCDDTLPDPVVSASKEENDTIVDSIADVGTMSAATSTSSSSTRSAAVHYFAVMAVGVVGAVFTVTTL